VWVKTIYVKHTLFSLFPVIICSVLQFGGGTVHMVRMVKDIVVIMYFDVGGGPTGAHGYMCVKKN
jgi:hypothetical protein